MICTPYTSLEPGVRRLTFHDFSLISFGGEELLPLENLGLNLAPQVGKRRRGR